MADEDVLSLEDNITNIAVALLWFFGCSLMVVEPLRTQCHRGLSVNMLLINIVGYGVLTIHNLYGFFADSPYFDNVSWSDLFTSGFGLICSIFGFVVIRSKKNTENDFDYFGIGVAVSGFLGIGISICAHGANENVFKDMLLIESLLYLLGFVSQICLLAKNRFTKGWSMEAVICFAISWIFAMMGMVFDFIIMDFEPFLQDDLGTRKVIKGIFTLILLGIITY